MAKIAPVDDATFDLIPNIALMRDISKRAYRRTMMAMIVDLVREGQSELNWSRHPDDAFMDDLIAELKAAGYKIEELAIFSPPQIRIWIA